MEAVGDRHCTAFVAQKRLRSGTLPVVAQAVKEHSGDDSLGTVLIFDDATGQVIDIDFRGSVEDVLRRLDGEERSEARRPGRPKLGVVAREVTLLPRHWEWLNSQPGGASVALRKLVEEARRTGAGKDRRRKAQEAVYRFSTTMAGNEPGYEEAMRALFAGNLEQFRAWTQAWPADVRKHARKLVEATTHPALK